MSCSWNRQAHGLGARAAGRTALNTPGCARLARMPPGVLVLPPPLGCGSQGLSHPSPTETGRRSRCRPGTEGAEAQPGRTRSGTGSSPHLLHTCTLGSAAPAVSLTASAGNNVCHLVQGLNNQGCLLVEITRVVLVFSSRPLRPGDVLGPCALPTLYPSPLC